MHGILLTIHVILSVLLILVILIQSGRSGGFSGLFGGGGDALFSTSSQQSGLRNATMIIAGLFFMTSLGLTMLSSRRGMDTVFNRGLPTVPPVNVPAPATQDAPTGMPDVKK
jgi:preprotein translocase subunit SecG